ncbi:MAG: hypothetical protein JOY64_07625 [Alphaproteobacteria bacterium]|nr:hypothetical protein [Alphaproteobacteria bacterium]MBV8407484.1 hypothetical protein [Alphaproteobacteria bacterium]
MSISGSLIAAALAVALFISPSLARDVRQPASGEPAIAMSVPDNWEAAPIDDGSTFSVLSPDHRIGFALTVAAPRAETIEAIARAMLSDMKGTLSGKQEASLSGHAGETYSWTYVNPHGVKLIVTTTLVKVGDKVASCSKLEVDGNSATQRELAESVRQSARILPPAAGK